jgi:hypothetical protein
VIVRTLLAAGIIFAVIVGWIAVQSLARRWAARHPELGPAREEGTGCGGCQSGGHCGSRCDDTDSFRRAD